MGLRFRKQLRIIKLVRLNISKSGISTTIGPRGASINIGRRGIFRNLGIPGSGFFMRDRIAGPYRSVSSSTHSRALAAVVVVSVLCAVCAVLICKFI
jgi:Protein of unknown function (DUF4236)